MVTLLKLGGSLITDKTEHKTLRPDILKRITGEIQSGREKSPEMQLIIGHGSGSFGHFEASAHDTIHGVNTSEQWVGFAKVAQVAAELNFHVASALNSAGVPVFRVQASASAIARAGIIQNMAIQPILRAIKGGIVPLVYGDVAFDDEIGGTIISTETIFSYLVSKLPVTRILLMGDVDGVYDESGEVIPHITRENFASIQSALGGSGGVDVTGGMLTKVHDMLRLANHPPYPDVYILNGRTENLLQDALSGERVVGTKLSKSMF